MNKWRFWKSRRYIVWRLHTVYGVSYESGLLSAFGQVIRKIGIRQFLKDISQLNRWLNEMQKEIYFKK